MEMRREYEQMQKAEKFRAIKQLQKKNKNQVIAYDYNGELITKGINEFGGQKQKGQSSQNQEQVFIANQVNIG